MRLLLAIGATCLVGATAAWAADPSAERALGPSPEVTNNLVFVRQDGSVVQFPPTVFVFCGKWEPDVPKKALQVGVADPVAPNSFWYLKVVPADVRRKPVLRLPTSFVSNKPVGALMFAVDGTNELSTQEEESQGRIVFERARCGPRLRVRFHIRAKIGSEFYGAPRIGVRGEFTARANRAPALRR